MNKMPLDQFYAENDKLIHFATLKAMKRFKSAGLENHVEYEEIYARLTEIFVKSYHGFDPEKAHFSTYFVRAATNAITSLIEDMYRLDIRVDQASALGAYNNDEGESSFEDDIFKCNPMIEQEVELQDAVRHVSKNLSPLAQTILSFTLSPPKFIQDEFLAQRAQCEFARLVGQRTFHEVNLDIRFVANCLKNTVDSSSELKSISNAVDEVKNAIKHVVSV